MDADLFRTSPRERSASIVEELGVAKCWMGFVCHAAIDRREPPEAAATQDNA
jgi:hypothetical protein